MLFSDLGIFANVVVSASYHQRSHQPLSANLLFKSLQIVIGQHPLLSVIFRRQSSLTKAGNHQLWKARLNSINIEDCVSFLDDYDDSDIGMRKLFEKVHNEWFDTEDKTRPLWKVIVVNRVHVLFVYHHAVCDGIAGTAFHQSLLAALNKVSKEDYTSSSSSFIASTPDTPFPADAIPVFQEQSRSSSIIRIIILYVWLRILSLFLRKRDWVFSDANYSMQVPAVVNGPRSEGDRCVTRLQSLRLSSSVLTSSLEACKKNNTTFTSMLVTLIDTTLATDIYPSSKYRILATQVNLRRYAAQKDNIRNLGSTLTQASSVSAHRNVTKDSLLRSSPETLLGKTEVAMDKPLFWELARKHNNSLKRALTDEKNITPVPIQDLLLLSKSNDDEEAVASQLLPGIGVMAEHSYCMSNLGAFEQRVGGDGNGMQGDEETGPWKIGDIEFTCSATAPCCGYLLYFAVLSLKGGACMVNISYVKGVLEDERVTMIIDKIELRLKALLESN